MGSNLFGKLPGTETNKTSIMTGSHVDTVKNGGMYDGTFGIAAGVIALKFLKQHSACRSGVWRSFPCAKKKGAGFR